MRANLRLDIEISLAYIFGKKAYFWLFYVKSYFGRGRVFFSSKRVNLFAKVHCLYDGNHSPMQT